MSWNLAGSYFETCSCEVVCPCTASLTLGADYDRCNATLVFHIKSGEIEGTDVSGLTVAAIADTPKVMSDGNWRLGVFIDDAASDQQAQKLNFVMTTTGTNATSGAGWTLQLRPVVHAADSPESVTTLGTVLRDGLSKEQLKRFFGDFGGGQ